jgi:hypothetical protein
LENRFIPDPIDVHLVIGLGDRVRLSGSSICLDNNYDPRSI